MKKLYYEYDGINGRLINTYIYTPEEYEKEKNKKKLTDIKIENGFFIPKFNGSKWIEDGTKKEISDFFGSSKLVNPEVDNLKKELEEIKKDYLLIKNKLDDMKKN